VISLWSLVVVLLLVAFFGFTLIAGYIGAKRTKKGLHEFYVAGGTLSAITVMFTYMATYMEAYEFCGMPALFVSEGMQWWMVEMAFYPFYVGLFIPICLKIYKLGKLHKYITPTDHIVHRAGGFEKPLRIILAILMFWSIIVYTGMIYIPAAGVLSAATGGEVPYHLFLLLYVLFIVIYVSAGGMRAVAYADVIAGFTFLVAFTAMIYTTFTYWGGFHKLAWAAYTSNIAPLTFTRTLPVQYYITYYLFVGLSWLFIPYLVVRIYAAKDWKGVVVGGMGVNMGFFIGAFLSPLLLGLSLAAYYGANLPEVPVVEGYVASLFKDIFGIGPLLALILLGLIAITRSTIDSMLLTAASIIDEDIIEKTLGIKVSERTRSIITRVVVIACALASIAVAYAPEAPMVIMTMELVWPIFSIIGCTALVQILWPRSNKYGALAGYLSGLISLVLLNYVIWPEAPHNPFGLWDGTLPTIVALAALVIVSLLTPPPPKEFIKQYYGTE
jgi:sodium/proline symporter